MHTKISLENDLKNMGLRPQDTVLMHSSMKAIGSVEGGADTVLDALCDYFAPGLVMLPALTWTVANMDDPVFDVRGTAAVVYEAPRCGAFLASHSFAGRFRRGCGGGAQGGSSEPHPLRADLGLA